MLELLIGAAVAAAVGVAVVRVAVLGLRYIKDWFVAHKRRNQIAVLVRTELARNNVTVYQGLLDEKTDRVEKVRAIRADRLEEDVDQMFQGRQVAVVT